MCVVFHGAILDLISCHLQYLIPFFVRLNLFLLRNVAVLEAYACSD